MINMLCETRYDGITILTFILSDRTCTVILRIFLSLFMFVVSAMLVSPPVRINYDKCYVNCHETLFVIIILKGGLTNYTIFLN